VSYEYRVFMVHEAKESTFLHLSAEPLTEWSLKSRGRAANSMPAP
jgi:hypothetical protein